MNSEKTDVMVALAAAIGANCIPCFDHLYGRAKEIGVSREEIARIVETANKVKTGAAVFLKNAITDVMGNTSEASQPCGCGTEKNCC